MCVSFRCVVCVPVVCEGEERGGKEDCRPSASLCASHSGSETRGHCKKRKFAHTEGPNHPLHKTQPAFHGLFGNTHTILSFLLFH